MLIFVVFVLCHSFNDITIYEDIWNVVGVYGFVTENHISSLSGVDVYAISLAPITYQA